MEFGWKEPYCDVSKNSFQDILYNFDKSLNKSVVNQMKAKTVANSSKLTLLISFKQNQPSN